MVNNYTIRPMDLMLVQGEPLPLTNGVITPINGTINGFSCGYKPTYRGPNGAP